MKLHLEDGLSYAEIAEKEHISRQRVGQIVKQALNDVAAEHQVFAKRLHQLRAEQFRRAKYELFKIMQDPCPECVNQPNFWPPRHRQGLPNCEHCKGDGYQYGIDARIRALITALVRTLELERRLVPIPPQPETRDHRPDLIAEILEILDDPDLEAAYLEPLGEPTGQPNSTPPEGSSALIGQGSGRGDPAVSDSAAHEAEAERGEAMPDLANTSDASEEASGEERRQGEEQTNGKRSMPEPYHGWPEGRMAHPSR